MKKYMILLLIALLAACSSNDVPLPPADAWLPVVSRAEAAADAKEYLVTLKYGSTTSSGTLVAGSTSSWKNEVPQWPADNQAVDVLALYPAKDVMPSVLADDAIYLMHYSQNNKNTKPAQLTMHHLMAQIKVQILVHQKEAHTPKDGQIRLRRQGTVCYGPDVNGAVPHLDAAPHKAEESPLGQFELINAVDAVTSEWKDGIYENTPATVVPQTFGAGEECLTFWVNDVLYVFKPEKAITLVAGKINILKLGVTYTKPEVDDDEGEGGSSGTGAPIPTVELQGITVADWVNGGTITGGEAEEK